MSTVSPTAFLEWAIISVLFMFFMIHHIWRFDKFNCLKWNSGRQPGAFKRIMTYSYLITVPLLVFFSVAMTLIKFKEGWIVLPNGKIVPKPVFLYSTTYKPWILPLYIVFSSAWAFELITHLEELTFWLFMLHQAPGKDHWFSSWEYLFWYLGSILALVGLPMTALMTRKRLMTCDAWVILVGSSGSTLTTILFLYVLWKFPCFLRQIKLEGVDLAVIDKLNIFYHINLGRVVFRLLFTLPLLILSIDAVMDGEHPINKHVFWADVLFMVGGLGCFFSSAMTLFIFFPRSLTTEAGYDVSTASQQQQSIGLTSLPAGTKSPTVSQSGRQSQLVSTSEYGSGMHRTRRFRSIDVEAEMESINGEVPPYNNHEESQPYNPPAVAYPMLSRPLAPHARRASASIHPYVSSFVSPIDLIEIPATAAG